MSDYEIVWSGRGSIPGVDYSGWQYKQALFVDKPIAPPSRARQPRKPVTNRTALCACGRWKHTYKQRCRGCMRGKAPRTASRGQDA